METPSFRQRYLAFTQWKSHLIRTVNEFASWLDAHGRSTPESLASIRQSLESLEQDRLTLAFVAEFSRGKTELINAMFFADHGRRLLPSGAGRTTMCPTEMLWDSARNEAYLRLLPIETRRQDTCISELRLDARQWVHYPLNVAAPEQMESTLAELVQTKRVPVEDAINLGLGAREPHLINRGPQPDAVEIPKWRHAIVSFPHPLLQQGLVILDTPGLNALGSEPELTLSMLPSAHAVLFVLAADTGVTRSDLEMWQNHIKGFQSSRQREMLVVLNKIDTLWDDLQDKSQVEEAIAKQKRTAASTLGIREQGIFPLSARKALLARVRNDRILLEKSAVRKLEQHLAEDLLKHRQQIIQDKITAEVGQMIDANRSSVSNQLHGVRTQLRELEELSEKSDGIVDRLLERTRQEQAEYLRSVSHFQSSRETLQEDAVALREILNVQRIERFIEEAHREMANSWTTRGMKVSMKHLFDELRRTMQVITMQADNTRKRVRAIYQHFERECGVSTLQPLPFSVTRFRVELEVLHQEAEAFRNSTAMTMTEQTQVIKRFFRIMVRRARDIFALQQEALSHWLSTALDPLLHQIQEHKDMMEKRLDNLQKISQSKEALQTRIDSLQQQYSDLARQLTGLRNLYNGLHQSPLATPAERRATPRLAGGRAAS